MSFRLRFVTAAIRPAVNSESLAASEVPLPRRRLWPRVVLAGPLTVICSVLVMCGGSLWLPKGAAQIDNIVLPIGLFPAIWAVFFFYASLDRRLGRAYAVILGLSLLHALAIALHVMEVRA
jgi:hypothetical protein